MAIPKKGMANLSHSVEHIAGETQFCLTLPKNCAATFSDLKNLLRLIHVHFYMAKFTTLGGHEQKEPKKNGKDYSSNAQKVQFQKTISIEYFRKLTDL